jgi:hypothetical protein
MSFADFWYRTKLLYLSKPAGERSLYKAVRGRPIQSILEIGIEDGRRTAQLLKWLHHQGIRPTKYAAIDPFELGGASHLSMKDAYKALAGFGFKPCLVPGNFESGALRVLHTIGPCDLIVAGDPTVEFSLPANIQLASRLLAPTGLLVANRGANGFKVVEGWETSNSTAKKAA